MKKIDNQSFFQEKTLKKWPFQAPHILLENPHSEENIGAIIRLADNLGVPKVFILNGGDYKWNKIKRNATTAYKKVEVVQINDLETIALDYEHLIAVDTLEGACDVMDYKMPKSPVLLCFGNESTGLSQELAEKMNEAIYIPVLGATYSLNLSQSVGISIYLLFKGL